jgi:hypothetical protein
VNVCVKRAWERNGGLDRGRGKNKPIGPVRVEAQDRRLFLASTGLDKDRSDCNDRKEMKDGQHVSGTPGWVGKRKRGGNGKRGTCFVRFG